MALWPFIAGFVPVTVATPGYQRCLSLSSIAASAVLMQLLLSLVVASRCRGGCRSQFNESSNTTSSFQQAPNQGGSPNQAQNESPPTSLQQYQLLWAVVMLGVCLFMTFSAIISSNNLKGKSEARKAHDRTSAAMTKRKFIRQADAVECSICLSEFETGDSMATLRCCSHSFHEACIMRWLSVDALTPSCQRTTCPLCKRDVHIFGEYAVTTSDSPSSTERTGHSSPTSSARVAPAVEMTPVVEMAPAVEMAPTAALSV